jgi:hypothetical protein
MDGGQSWKSYFEECRIFRVHCFSGKIFSQNLKILHT